MPVDKTPRAAPIHARHALREALHAASALPAHHPDRPTAAHLHLLCLAHALDRADRFEIARRAEALQTTVDRRLRQLLRAGLLKRTLSGGPGKGRLRFRPSADGETLIGLFAAGRDIRTFLDVLRGVRLRTGGERDGSISVARPGILRQVAHEGERTVTSLLPRLGVSEPTLRSRISYLERLEFFGPEERFDRGGGGGGSNPTRWRITSGGHALLRGLMSGPRAAPR